MTDEKKMLGTRELGAKFKIDPKQLRAIIREANGKAPGKRYEWAADDAFLKKLPQLIKAHGAAKGKQ